MSQPTYVRHVSGQGDVYCVRDDGFAWTTPGWPELRLPKAGYCVYMMPEQWEDVTPQCEVNGVRIRVRRGEYYDFLDAADSLEGVHYRLRKVATDLGWAFLVERRRQP